MMQIRTIIQPECDIQLEGDRPARISPGMYMNSLMHAIRQ
jgi:hypothetical protein